MKLKEDHLQIQCVEWFKWQYKDVIIYSIPNGGSRHPAEAAKLKRTGVLKGVPDLFIASVRKDRFSDKVYGGLYIELKVHGRKMSEAQTQVSNHLKKSSYRVILCDSFELFQFVVNDYFSYFKPV